MSVMAVALAPFAGVCYLKLLRDASGASAMKMARANAQKDVLAKMQCYSPQKKVDGGKWKIAPGEDVGALSTAVVRRYALKASFGTALHRTITPSR